MTFWFYAPPCLPIAQLAVLLRFLLSSVSFFSYPFNSTASDIIARPYELFFLP